MKRFCAGFVLLAALFLFSSCASSALEGKWKTSFDSAEAGGRVELVYEFSPYGNLFVGSGEGKDAFSLYFGTYSVSGEGLLIESDDGEKLEYRFSVDGDTLTLTDRASGASTTFTRA